MRFVGSWNLLGRSSLFRVFLSVESHSSSINFSEVLRAAIKGRVASAHADSMHAPSSASLSAVSFPMMPK